MALPALPKLPPEPVELPAGKPKQRPKVLVRAATEGPASEWGSLLGDLSRPSRSATQVDVEWRVHDRTHLEFAIDYPFEAVASAYTWESFFFIPDSLRLAQTTYDKRQIYDDLLSYVRLAVPELPFDELARSASSEPPSGLLHELRASVNAAGGSRDGDEASRVAVRRLRIFACVLRASGLDAKRRLMDELRAAGTADEAARAITRFTGLTHRLTGAYRATLERSGERAPRSDEVEIALRWVDEDMSLFLETLFATASVELGERAERDPSFGEVAAQLAREAVREARYRKDLDYPSVGSEHATPRDIEHIEFRRHVLKRFTSSVLWLKHEVRAASPWVLHSLYAVAAAVAMAFAVFVTLRATEMQSYLTLYFVLLVVSYAVKDRMKALLQDSFTKWAAKRFADRAWTIRDEERAESVGVVRERAAFRAFAKMPPEVLEVRRLTREHALEEHARPESVLWHEKRVDVIARKDGSLPSPMMTEIFRLNIGSWLAHTDDPNRSITFADPDAGVVCSATARRVYNINIVYRLRKNDDPEPSWKRIRVVVSRKGIERIDPIA